MPVSTASAAIIYFVGIVVFSNQFSQDGGLRAMMPRIPGPAHEHVGAKQRTDKEGAPTAVESHVALIAFRACDYISSKGWAPVGLEAVPGLLYVKLDGEHVKFTSTGRVIGDPIFEVEEIKLRQRQTKGKGRLDAEPRKELGLPHLQTSCCPKMKALKDDFKPPFKGAAAVLDVSNGTPKPCRAKGIAPPGQGVPELPKRRIDTQVAIPTNGALVITGTKDDVTREIRVRGDALVYAANMPSGFLEDVVGNSRPHFEAYYAMADNTEGCTGFGCSADATLTECDPVADLRIGIDGTVVPERPPIDLTAYARFDFECSNSQWP